MLKLENITKSYRIGKGRHFLFRNVSLEFPEEANLGILGPNGAGKTTLLRIIGGIDYPDSGRVVCDKSLSWPMGITGGFIPHLTGKENSEIICRIYGLDRATIRDRVAFIRDFCELGPYFDEPIQYYSSGMNGRLNFALSLSFDFDYLLIDEVTSVGDRQFREKARAALEEKRKSARVIMVSHSSAILREFCEIGLLVKDGELKLFETLDDAVRAYFPPVPKAERGSLNAESKLNLQTLLGQREDSEEDEHQVLKRRLANVIRELKNAFEEENQIQNEGQICHRLGVLFFQAGNWTESLIFHRKAVYFSEMSIDFYPPYITCLFQLGQLEEAKTILGKVLEWQPDHKVLKGQRVNLLVRLGDLEKAEAEQRALLELDPENPASYHQFANILLLRGKADEALKWQMKALEHDDSNPPFFDQLSRILASLGKWEDSMDARFQFEALTLAKPPPKSWETIYHDILVHAEKALRRMLA